MGCGSINVVEIVWLAYSAEAFACVVAVVFLNRLKHSTPPVRHVGTCQIWNYDHVFVDKIIPAMEEGTLKPSIRLGNI